MGDDPIEETLPEEMIDKTLEESFPASDPPSWTLGREKRKPWIRVGEPAKMETGAREREAPAVRE
jgi:hypothetical protein